MWPIFLNHYEFAEEVGKKRKEKTLLDSPTEDRNETRKETNVF